MEHGLARNSDPETSHEAARSVAISYLEGKVLGALNEADDGHTTEELSDLLGLPRVTVSPRMAPLVRKGLVYASAKRRRGNSGRNSIVFYATRVSG